MAYYDDANNNQRGYLFYGDSGGGVSVLTFNTLMTRLFPEKTAPGEDASNVNLAHQCTDLTNTTEACTFVRHQAHSCRGDEVDCAVRSILFLPALNSFLSCAATSKGSLLLHPIDRVTTGGGMRFDTPKVCGSPIAEWPDRSKLQHLFVFLPCLTFPFVALRISNISPLPIHSLTLPRVCCALTTPRNGTSLRREAAIANCASGTPTSTLTPWPAYLAIPALSTTCVSTTAMDRSSLCRQPRLVQGLRSTCLFGTVRAQIAGRHAHAQCCAFRPVPSPAATA